MEKLKAFIKKYYEGFAYLFFGGLATGHVQLQTLCLELVVFIQNGGVLPCQFGGAHARIGGHKNHPFGLITVLMAILYAIVPKNAR